MLRSCLFLLLAVVSSCSHNKTQKGFFQWMNVQVGKPISDVYNAGFEALEIRKDGKGMVLHKFVEPTSYDCNITWIVDDKKNRIGYNYDGSDCKEYEIGYFLKKYDESFFANVVTAPAVDYVKPYSNVINGYTSNNYKDLVINGTFLDKTVSVAHFKDRRAGADSDATLLWMMVPLMPYGWIEKRHAGIFCDQSLVKELEISRIFKKVLYNATEEVDYIIQGRILSSLWLQRWLSYGLGMFNVLPIIGAPQIAITADLSLKLDLIDAKTNTVVFSKNYNAEQYSHIIWLYTLFAQTTNDFFPYPDMLPGLYKQFIEDIAKI